MNSLSTVGIEKIQNYKKEYYLGPFDKDGDTWKSGILLLKIIIRESYIDSRAKVSAIRNQMASLPTYIEEVGYDIIKFNDRVNTLVAELRAHGHTSTDLLVNLLRSYVEVKDDDFRKYIKELYNVFVQVIIYVNRMRLACHSVISLLRAALC